MSDDLDNFRGSRYIKLLDPFNSSLDCVSISIPFPQGGGFEESFLRRNVCVCVTRKWLRKDGEIN